MLGGPCHFKFVSQSVRQKTHSTSCTHKHCHIPMFLNKYLKMELQLIRKKDSGSPTVSEDGFNHEEQKECERAVKQWILDNSGAKFVNVNLYEAQGSIIPLYVGKYSIINIITNWEILWNQVNDSDGDVFGDTAPLFQASINVLFCQTSFKLIVCLFIYMNFIMIFWLINYPQVLADVIAGDFIPNLVFFTLYYWSYSLYRGTCIETNIPAYRNIKPAVECKSRSDTNPLILEQIPENRYIFEQQTRSESYVVDAFAGVSNRRFTRDKTYKGILGKLLRETIFIPCLGFYRKLLSLCLCCCCCCCSRFTPDDETQEKEPIEKKLGFYQLLNTTTKFLYIHNCDIPNASKMIPIAMSLFIVIITFQAIRHFGDRWATYALCHGENPQLSGRICNVMEVDMILEGGYVLPAFYRWFIGYGLCALLAGIAYGTHLCHSLSAHWIRRFASLRLLKEPGNASAPVEGIDGTVEDGVQYNISDTISLIRGDAVECYLFRQRIIRGVSDTWNLFLVVYLVAICILMIATIVQKIRSPAKYYPMYIFIIYMGIALIFLLFPLVGIAHANFGSDKLKSKIFLSSLEDFSALGGRDKWIKYISSNPTYWTIFNVAITCKFFVLWWFRLVKLMY